MQSKLYLTDISQWEEAGRAHGEVFARESDVNLRLTRLKPAVRAVLERDGVIERIGTDMIHGNIHRAVQAEQAAAQKGPDDAAGQPQ